MILCRRNYFDATDALVYVIDSFDRKRIVESGSELDIILEVRHWLVAVLTLVEQSVVCGAEYAARSLH